MDAGRGGRVIQWFAGLLALGLLVQILSFMGVGPVAFVGFIVGVGLLGGGGIVLALRRLWGAGR
jgi:hypothetical protein